MKKIILLFVIIITCQSFSQISARIGASAVSGIIGAEYREDNVAINCGWLPAEERAGIGFGLLYYLKKSSGFYCGLGYMFNGSNVTYHYSNKPDVKKWGDDIHVLIGYNFVLSEKWSVRVGSGADIPSISGAKFGPSVDLSFGYTF
jgi:hypothetical protein